MSCFEVCSTHIDVLVTAGLACEERYGIRLRWLWPRTIEPGGPEAVELDRKRSRELNSDTAGQVGAMLAAENRRSVDHRYDEIGPEIPYTFERIAGAVEPVVVLKAIDCYEYQSCEHPEWEESEAHEFCQVLRKHMIARLLDYNDAPWEITDRNVFQNVAG